MKAICELSYFYLKARLIFTAPQFVRLLIVQDMTVFRIDIQRASHSVSDVTQLHQQGTDMACCYISMELRSFSDGIEEIIDMDSVQCLGRIHQIVRVNLYLAVLFLDKLIIHIIDTVSVIAWNNQIPFGPIEDNAGGTILNLLKITTTKFQGHRFFPAIIDVDDLCVGRFPIIMIAITSSDGVNPGRVVQFHTPTEHVDHVRAVVQGLACAPMPEPMPVVMHDVVFVRTAWGRALPKVPIQPLRHSCFFPFTNRGSIICIPSLSEEDITHYKQMIAAIRRTIEIMDEIDEVIEL